MNPTTKMDYRIDALEEIEEISFEGIWVADKKDSKLFMNGIMSFLPYCETPLVLNIDSSWGSGKTFLAKRWVRHLQKEKNQVVYYNAWECDTYNDAFITFFTTILDQLQIMDVDIEKKGIGIQSLLKTGTNIITNKFLSTSLDQIRDQLTDSDNPISKYREYKSLVKSLRVKLKELANRQDKGNPIYIFIDELDRCKPTFAVELLEVIKHIFSIEGYVFILLSDTSQLSQTVRNFYGSNFNAEKYLNRLFDIHLALPNRNSDDYIMHIQRDRRLLFPSISISATNESIRGLHVTKFFLSDMNLNPREQIQYITSISQMVSNSSLESDGNDISSLLVLYLLYIKIKVPDIYHIIKIDNNWGPAFNYFEAIASLHSDYNVDALCLILLNVNNKFSNQPINSQFYLDRLSGKRTSSLDRMIDDINKYKSTFYRKLINYVDTNGLSGIDYY